MKPGDIFRRKDVSLEKYNNCSDCKQGFSFKIKLLKLDQLLSDLYDDNCWQIKSITPKRDAAPITEKMINAYYEKLDIVAD